MNRGFWTCVIGGVGCSSQAGFFTPDLGTRENDAMSDTTSAGQEGESEGENRTDGGSSPYDWGLGLLNGVLPDLGTLQLLPGEGTGPPVVTSNNPESFTGDGLLFGTARASEARGGSTLALDGDFGVYLHHLNSSGTRKFVTVMITNPNESEVTVSGYGSGYTQTETGGLGLGTSPDYVVSEDWITEQPRTVLAPTGLDPFRPLALWQSSVNSGAEFDGRFAVNASLPVYVYVVVTSTDDLNEAINDGLVDAPGSIAVSGDPPPPYGREAGVYEHDTWAGTIELLLPAAERHLGFIVNSATGTGLPQVQAFPALMHYEDSAAESVGNYGNVYDLDLVLQHDGEDDLPRHVRVWFASYSGADISRLWDGAALVDGELLTLRNTPDEPMVIVADVTVGSRETRTVSFRAMVPGLTSIPQALLVESY